MVSMEKNTAGIDEAAAAKAAKEQAELDAKRHVELNGATWSDKPLIQF